MGILSSIGGLFGGSEGGYGPDNPDFRQSAEATGFLQRIALLAQTNPELVRQYFNSPNSQQAKELKLLGINTPEDLENFIQNADQFAPDVAIGEDYKAISDIYNENLGKAEGFLGLENQFQDILNQYNAGRGVELSDIENLYSGLDGNLTDYDQGYTFNMADIDELPDQIYNEARDMEQEELAKGFKGALESLGNQFARRGFGRGMSGLEQAGATDLGREYLNTLANVNRNITSRKAADKLGFAQYLRDSDFRRQQAQAAENSRRSSYLSDIQKYARNFGLQKAGALQGGLLSADQARNARTSMQSGLVGSKGNNLQAYINNRNNLAQNMQQNLAQRTQAGLLPYNMDQNYYNTTLQSGGPAPSKGILGNVAEGAANALVDYGISYLY